MKLILAILFSLSVSLLYSQQNPVISDVLEFMQENNDEEQDYQVLYELLLQYTEQPVSLNDATAEELERLVFLTPLQVQALIGYRTRYKVILEWEELQQVEGFYPALINQLRHFATLNGTDENLLSNLKSGNFELTTRFSSILRPSAGYFVQPGDSVKAYRGNKTGFYSRMRYSKAGKFSAGLITEKDAGELFFAPHTYAPDFTSFHIFYKPENKPVKSVVLGDYQMSSGQGLVFNSSTGFNKSSQTLMIKKGGQGFRPYTSVNESGFLRGAAISLGKKGFSTTLLASSKSIDGSIDNNGRISSVYTNGLHRTGSEIKRRKTVDENIFGLAVLQHTKRFDIGIASSYYQLSSPGKKPGIKGAAAGLSFHCHLGHGILFGESAIDINRKFAHLYGMIYSLNNKTGFSALYRNYAPGFENRYGNSFTASGRNFNEKGLYIGWEYMVSGLWKLNAYIDQYQYAAPSFYTSSPARQFDYIVQLTFSRRKKFTVYARGRFQTRQRDFAGENLPVPYQQFRNNYRLNGELILNPQLTLRTRMEYSQRKDMAKAGNGWLMYQDVLIDLPKPVLSLTLRYAVFEADSYDDRLYAFENDVLYSYSIPAYTDRGQRFYILLKSRLNRYMDVWLRYSSWVYQDKTSISSGNDKIAGNRKPQVTVQLQIGL